MGSLAKETVFRLLQPGIQGYQALGCLLSDVEKLDIGKHVRQLKHGQSVLPVAEKIAGPPEFKILFGNAKAV